MNKEQLKTKVDALQANLDVRKSELTTAQVELGVALNELADAGKPVISCDLVGDLMDQIEETFSETLLNSYEYLAFLFGLEVAPPSFHSKKSHLFL